MTCYVRSNRLTTSTIFSVSLLVVRCLLLSITIPSAVLVESFTLTIPTTNKNNAKNKLYQHQHDATNNRNFFTKRGRRSDLLTTTTTTNTKLHSISEWRESLLSSSSPSIPTSKLSIPSPSSSPLDKNNILHLLAFHISNPLFVGQTITMKFNQGRFYDLLEESIEENYGVIGIAFIDDDGLLSCGTMVLCEIIDMDVKAGYRGRIDIDATIQCVSRAKLEKLIQMKPTMKGLCNELHDDKKQEINDRENNDENYDYAKTASFTSTRFDHGNADAQRLMNQIKILLQDLDATNSTTSGPADKDDDNPRYIQRYKEAYKLTKACLQQQQQQESQNDEGEEQYDDELLTSSWAIFHCMSALQSSSLEKSSSMALSPHEISNILSSSNIIERLQIGIKALTRLAKEDGNVGGVFNFDEETDFQ